MNTSQKNIKSLIFDKSISFEQKAFEVLQFQLKNLPIFKVFSNKLYQNLNPNSPFTKYPFLPISFFKTADIISNGLTYEKTFESSGTTSTNNSRHLVADLDIYHQSILNGFKAFYGNPSDFIIYGLLPSYLERENASLVYMVNYLMEQSNHPRNKFYKFNYQDLLSDLKIHEGSRKKLIIGVTFALWDMAEQPNLDGLKDCIISETGGMKGRRKEILRAELHQILKKAFDVDSIHSEYGMTELLSQAYSKQDGIFKCSDTMKVLVRDPYDPTIVKTHGKGVLNIIDLANLNSCSFIATDDLGEIFEDGSFKVLGRQDSSEMRGCNLMFNV